MEGREVFVNNFLEYALTSYNHAKNSNGYYKSDLYSTTLKILMAIYGEINIINPFLSRNTEKFKENLLSYGYNAHYLEIFLANLEKYHESKDKNLVEDIQKALIDMLVCKSKKQKIQADEYEYIKSLLYTKDNSNLLIKLYSVFLETKENRIEYYWQRKMYEIKTPIIFKEVKINYLSESQYALYGFSLEQMKRLRKEEVDLINNRILNDMDSSTEGGRVANMTADSVKRLVLTSGKTVFSSLLFIIFISTELFLGIMIAISLLGG